MCQKITEISNNKVGSLQKTGLFSYQQMTGLKDLHDFSDIHVVLGIVVVEM